MEKLAISFKTKVALTISIFLWASAFVGIRCGLKDYSPEGLALLRYMIASLFMGIVYYRQQPKNKINLKDACALCFVGMFGIGIYNITLNYGELSISSGMASFITNQSPIVTTLFAIIFLGEEFSTPRLIGFAISIVGIMVIAFSEIGEFKWDVSIYSILLATFAGGCYSIMQKPLLEKYNVIEATTYVIWGGTLFLLWYTPLLYQDLTTAPISATLPAIYLGIFPAAIGYIAWSVVLSEIPATRAVSFLYFTPFVATLLGWLVLGEVPMPLSIAGGLLAIMGVWLVNQSYRRLEVVRP